MPKRSTGIPEKYRALYVVVLDTLKAQRCVASYKIVGHDIRIEWAGDGFDRAFAEFKAHPHSPFGLARKGERATYLLVLTQHDRKQEVDDFLIGGMKERFGLQ